MVVSSMYRRSLVCCVLAIFLIADRSEAQCVTPIVTLSSATLKLGCPITSNAVVVTWSEELKGGGENRLFAFSVFNGEISDYRQGTEYENFQCMLNPTLVFDLIITDVQIDDSGLYACTNTPGGILNFDVYVEVPGSVQITNGSVDLDKLTVTIGEVYTITCSANGTRSKNELSFVWEPPLADGTLRKQPNGDFIDYSITSTYSPKKEDESIKCQLTGYGAQEEIEDLVVDSISLIVRYKPECTMSLTTVGDDCTTVTLSCECIGVPEIMGYSYFSGGALMNATEETNITVKVDYDTVWAFSCKAFNDVGTGERSNERNYICEEDLAFTTHSSTHPSVTKGGGRPFIPRTDDQKCEPIKMNTGLIAACSIEAVIIVALALALIFIIRRQPNGYHDETIQRHFEGNDGTDNGAYMDLQELGTVKKGVIDNLQVPEENVRLISVLSGEKKLQYHKALVTRAKGNQEGVVRTMSADCKSQPGRDLLRSEALHNLKLNNGHNIVTCLGWCDTVPTYVIFDCVNGGNLSDHLKEEFNPHRVHTYGNTPKKRIQVSENGKTESLPNYALQVAEGIKFLTKNKFLHPGLRAKKVLLDTTGKCKLYDFVSSENACAWTHFFWVESVPYQWMPPEYLFREKISSAGDVWSFGVLLWEIFSYGAEPYMGQTRLYVENKLREKEMLPLPENCPGAIWQLMISCWEPTHGKRPDIAELTQRLASMCNNDTEYQEIKLK